MSKDSSAKYYQKTKKSSKYVRERYQDFFEEEKEQRFATILS